MDIIKPSFIDEKSETFKCRLPDRVLVSNSKVQPCKNMSALPIIFDWEHASSTFVTAALRN